MPCSTIYTKKDFDRFEITELLKEVGIYEKDISCYGNTTGSKEMIKMLCDFCNKNDVTKQSLGLQVWWNDHKQRDLEKKLQTNKTKNSG